MKKSALSVLFVAAAAVLPVHAASVFTFSGGCKMTCSGDWSFGSTPGSVACNGTVTNKTASCPAIAAPVGGGGAISTFKVDGALAADARLGGRPTLSEGSLSAPAKPVLPAAQKP